MPNPGELFSQLFGGKAFEDWIGEISLGKEVSKAFEQQEKEQEELDHEKTEKENKTDPPPSSSSSSTATPQSTIHSQAHVEQTPTVSPTGTPSTPSTSATSASAPSSSAPTSSSANPSTTPAEPAASSASSKEEQHPTKSHLAGKPPKLTPEQKQKAYEEEKKSYEEKRKRIQVLSEKLRDRVRGFVEATNPGDKDDQETKRWAEKIREQSHDLALESFGVGEFLIS